MQNQETLPDIWFVLDPEKKMILENPVFCPGGPMTLKNDSPIEEAETS